MVKSEVDRSTYLGSHDIAAIMGDHPFLTKMQVFLNKTGIPEDISDRPWIRWGNVMQGPILQEYCRKEDYFAIEKEEFRRHEKYDFIGSTPDGTIIDLKKSIDAKNQRFKTIEWGEEYSDQVPRYVLWQAHCHMTTWNHDVCDIPVLFSGCDHEIFRIEKDPEISEAIIEIAHTFWNDHILTKEPPDFDGSEATFQYLRKKFPSHTDELRAATTEEAAIMLALKILDEEKETNKKQIDLAKQQLQDAIGSDMGLTSGLGKVTWKEQKGATRIDSKMLKDLHPEIAKECSNTGDSLRVFRKAFKKV